MKRGRHLVSFLFSKKKGEKFQIWFKEVIQQQYKTSHIQLAMNDCKNEIQTHDNYVDGAKWHL